MEEVQQERRKSTRYEKTINLKFTYNYPVETKIKFRIEKEDSSKKLSETYSGKSRDISVEGLGFISDKKLDKGDALNLELYLPQEDKPINMQGEVRWSEVYQNQSFCTGVLLKQIEGKPVQQTIHFDELYHVHWSDVLEKVLGAYRVLMQEHRQKNKGVDE